MMGAQELIADRRAQMILKMLGISDPEIRELDTRVLEKVIESDQVQVYKVAGKVKGEAMTLMVITDRRPA